MRVAALVIGLAVALVALPPAAAAAGQLLIVDAGTLAIQERVPVDGVVTAATADGAHGWYVAGPFDQVGSRPRTAIARIDADGEVDGRFRGALTQHSAAFGFSVEDMAVGHRRVYAAGTFWFAGGAYRPGLAALDATTGRPRRAFRPPHLSSASRLLLRGRRLYVGAGDGVLAVGVRTGAVVARFRPRITTHPEVGYAAPLASANGRLLLSGLFLRVDGARRVAMTAVRSTGRLVRRWNARLGWPGDTCRPGPCAQAMDAVVSGDRVYVGGQFTRAGGTARGGLARLDASTGAVDPSWDPPLRGSDVAVLQLLVVRGRVITRETTATTSTHLGAYSVVDGRHLRLSRELARLSGVTTLAHSGDRILIATA